MPDRAQGGILVSGFSVYRLITRKKAPMPVTLDAALERLNVEQLTELLDLLQKKYKPTRKQDLISSIRQHLTGERLQALWARLDELQQLAVAETIYSIDGVFNADQFKAKYGALPGFSEEERTFARYSGRPSLLRLFIYSDQRWQYEPVFVPEDLKRHLLTFVAKPIGPVLQTLDALPTHVELSEKEYVTQPAAPSSIATVTRKAAVKVPTRQATVRTITRQVPLISRNTEQDAVADLKTLLRLTDKGKLAVSDKTRQPSAAAMKEITSLLRNGDFYELKPKQNKWEQEIAPIKAFAWPMLLQAARLAELHGSKLALTTAGRTALSEPPAKTLSRLWQCWSETKMLDEFNRVKVIKGQSGKGKRSLTSPADRRAVIEQAFQQCRAGVWVKFDDFSRYMQADGYEFNVSRDPWQLYIEDAHYGSLGYSGRAAWNILQARYLMCLCFEYMATLGMLDVAYIPPQQARRDYRDLWGVDELDFLSCYDGLMYMRLNSLGAYCLGLTKSYTPSEPHARTQLMVLPSLRVHITSGTPSSEEILLLDAWAEKETETVWRLSADKILDAVENGHAITELREFLQARDTQGLPDKVEHFLATTAEKANALKPTGTALLIECPTAEMAKQIGEHKRTQRWCLRAGERHLVVKLEDELRFRKAARGLGYGLPKA